MAVGIDTVYQFKIVLEGIEPIIWRRVRVPSHYSFWDLHVAIQDVMGWLDCHLHQFDIFNPRRRQKDRIGIPDGTSDDTEPMVAGWQAKIADYFSLKNKTADYLYDFGDSWQHKIMLEEIVSVDRRGQKYPQCIDGKGACPPEDCGGIPGYYSILKIMNNPKHEEYKNTLEWLGHKFEPEHFSVEQVHFDNPEKRLKKAFSVK